MSVVIAVEGMDTLDESEERTITTAIEDLLTEGYNLDTVTVLEESRLDDWEMGAPCPECGNSKVNVLEASDSWYRSSKGDLQWLEHGEGGSFVIDVLCSTCETTLYRHPAYTLMYCR